MQKRFQYRYQFNARQIKEIENAYKEATDPKILRRLEMLLLRTRNVPTQKIKELTGYDRDTVANHVNKYRKGGLKAVIGGWPIDKKYEYKYKFSKKQIREIKSAYKAASDQQIALRLKALLMRAQEIPFGEIRKQTGYTKPGIENMLKRYQDKGLAVIASQRILPYKHTFTENQIAEIKCARKKPSEQWVQRRLEALWLRANGARNEEVVKVTGYSKTTIQWLVYMYHKHGMSAIYGKADKNDILGKNVLK